MTGSEQLGKYTLLERIGVGGMAEVWLARATGPGGFNKACVVKTVRSGVDEERFRRMFMDEARLAAILNHPNIVQLFDFGEDGGRLYIVLEFILGRTLRALMKTLKARNMPFPLEHAARIMGGVLEGLEHAHNQVDKNGEPLKIIHRDVSPDNVMISYSGVPRLVDFGIAKATLSTDRTRAGRAKGKLLYMAPEQLTGMGLDHRVDIYACGVVLYELCCGVHPFPITTPEQLALAIVEQDPPHPQDVNRALPDELSEIILRCLRKDPQERFASARQMLEHLDGFLQSLTLTANAVRLDQLLSTVWAEEMAEDAARARRASDAVASIPPVAGRQTSLLSDGPEPDTVSDMVPREDRVPPRLPERPRAESAVRSDPAGRAVPVPPRLESGSRSLTVVPQPDSPPRPGPQRTMSGPVKGDAAPRVPAPPRSDPGARAIPPALAEPAPLQPPPPPLPLGENPLSTDDRKALDRVFVSDLQDVNSTAPDAVRSSALDNSSLPTQLVEATASNTAPSFPGPMVPAGTWLVARPVAVAALVVAALTAAVLSGSALWVVGLRTGTLRGQQLLHGPSRLMVNAPADCTVRVDDGSPSSGNDLVREVESGPHTITARCRNTATRIKVTTQPGRDLEVVVVAPAGESSRRGGEGSLVVSAQTSGTLYVDGARIGELPVKPLHLAAGKHVLRLSTRDGEQVQEVEVVAGETTTARFPSEPR